jgi:hypothetical protein
MGRMILIKTRGFYRGGTLPSRVKCRCEICRPNSRLFEKWREWMTLRINPGNGKRNYYV